MNLRRIALAVTAGGAAALVGGVAYAAAVTPSQPPGRPPVCAPCKTTVVRSTAGVLTTSNGEAQSAGNPASTAVVSVQGRGLKATLPDATAKAEWVPSGFASGAGVALVDVARLSYATFNENPASVAVWSYNIAVDVNGGALAPGDFTTLVYEPYQDLGGPAVHGNTWQTWDALRGGAAKWWSTHPLPLVSGGAVQASPQPWASIVAAYPAATILGVYANLGKGATGASARLDDFTFGTADRCVSTTWAARPVVSQSASPSSSSAHPSPSMSHSASSSPSPSHSTSPGTSASAIGSASVSSSAATGVGPADAGAVPPKLALTGFTVDPLMLAGGGTALLAGGFVVLYVLRSRRTAFRAGQDG